MGVGRRADITGGPWPQLGWTCPWRPFVQVQALSWTGVHTASPIHLWASASQGVEALPCGKECTLRSLDCTGVFGAKRDGLISCYFREPGKTMAKMQGGGRSRVVSASL